MDSQSVDNRFSEEEVLSPFVTVLASGVTAEFLMGSDCDLFPDDPPCPVALTVPYAMTATTVTFDAYDRFCEAVEIAKPSDEGRRRGKHPVTNITWFDAARFCNWVSDESGRPRAYRIEGSDLLWEKSKDGYRLPTEAEWEYAARGGMLARNRVYAGSDRIDEVAWYDGNSGGQIHEGGRKKSNELGLYDMSGNIWEWCWDWYDENYLTQAGTRMDPTGPDQGIYRVVRGGWCRVPDVFCRVATRFGGMPDAVYYGKGFRVVRPIA
jgi:sulfatase modifying factor 1